MTAYLWGGLALTIIGVLVALVVYATRAGRNAQNVQTSQQAAADAQATTQAVQAMSRAQADGPQGREQLLERLDGGTG